MNDNTPDDRLPDDEHAVPEAAAEASGPDQPEQASGPDWELPDPGDDLDATAAMPAWQGYELPGDQPDVTEGLPGTADAPGASVTGEPPSVPHDLGAGAAAVSAAGATAAASAGAAGATVVAPPLGAPSSKRRRALLIVGAIIAAIVLIAGLAWWVVTSSAQAREDAIRSTATAYLTAVAEADAEAALATLSEAPANGDLLTNDVLAASNQAAPLTDIVVSMVTTSERTATASVTYHLGDLPVEADLPLVGDGRTTWKISDGTSDLMVNQTEALTVNGATLREGTNPVFPGTYTATPTNELVTLTGEPSAVVPSPLHALGRITVTHELSESGRQRVLETVKGQFDTCLAATVSQPTNCPFGVDESNVTVTPDSVRFELLNDPWAGFSPQFDLATMSAKGTFPLQVNATANVTFEGRTGDVSIGLTGDRNFTVDLTREPLTVVWQ